MTSNLMEQYIKKTTTFLKNFTKMFLAEKYNEEISNEYIAAYIDSRIYNYGETEKKFFYKRIYASLLEKKNEIQKLYPKIDENVLENHLKLYEFVFYIDDVRPISDLTEFVNTICDKRRTMFEREDIKNISNCRKKMAIFRDSIDNKSEHSLGESEIIEDILSEKKNKKNKKNGGWVKYIRQQMQQSKISNKLRISTNVIKKSETLKNKNIEENELFILGVLESAAKDKKKKKMARYTANV